MNRLSLCAVLLLLTVVCASAQDTPFRIAPERAAGGATVFAMDERTSQPLVSLTAPWASLSRMTDAEKADAMIQVAVSPNSSPRALELARATEAEWNAGRHSTALLKLAALNSEVKAQELEVGIEWKNPKIVTGDNLLAGNVQIGTIDSVEAVSLVSDSTGAVLYALLSQRGDGLNGSWHAFRSSDGGATWSNTFSLQGAGTAPDIGMTMVRGYVYIGYSPAGHKVMRIRRLLASTGAFVQLTGSVNFRDIFTVPGSDSVTAVQLASNRATTFNNRVYFASSTSEKKVHFFWSDPLRDSVWTEMIDSAATNVRDGLSITHNAGPGNSPYVYVSYRDGASNVCIDSIRSVGLPEYFLRAYTYPGGNGHTSLSAYSDTVVCAIDYFSGNIQIRYLISYNAGKSWSFGTPEVVTEWSESPVVMLEKGQGMGMFYRFYTSTDREGRFIYRTYRGPGTWTSPVKITDYTPHYLPFGIAAMGNRTWGVLYITFNSSPAYHAAVFVKYQVPLTGVEETQQLIPTAFRLHQNFPNPFNPTTEIRYDLPAATQVTLTVFDMLGREVAQLVDGVQPAGQQNVRWNAAGAASGTYVCRLQAGSYAAVQKMMLVK